jgi:putative ATP-binding cassette transporter
MAQNSKRPPQKGKFLGKLWRLTWPYFCSEEWKIAWVLLVVAIALSLGRVYLGVLFNDWNRDFFNALEQKDLTPTPVAIAGIVLFEVNRFAYLLGYFLILAFIFIVVAVYGIYLGQILQLRWRRWMTRDLSAKWLANRAYYRLELTNDGTDNPEQRIEADVDSFTDATFNLSLSLLRNIVNLVTFTIVLWSLSGPLDFAIAGVAIHVPAYMVWVAVLYAAGGTLATFWLGKPLVKANFDQQRFSADFRFRLMRVREHAESVALYGGELHERAGFERSFEKVWSNWWWVMRLSKRLNWFTSFYDQLTVVFPFLVAAPRYFAGLTDFGTIFQVSNAFGRVQDSLSWFISVFQSLASWKATTDRLTTFVDAIEDARIAAATPELDIAQGARPELALTQGEIALPNGRTLLRGVDLNISAGDKVLITGPSGSGKTTLFRVLAGLWPFAKGRLRLPGGARVLFLSQKPYLPLGTLRQAVCFPGNPGEVKNKVVEDALVKVRLAQLLDRLDEEANWAMVLSVGEQQRLAIARVLINRPDWLFLDEATSALDSDNEEHVMGVLAQDLPNCTMVSIAHRPDVDRRHNRQLTIDPTRQSLVAVPISQHS